MKKIVFLLILTGLMMLSTSAYSVQNNNEVVLRCDTCTSSSHFSNAAEDSFKYYMPGIYSAEIVNTVTYEIWVASVNVQSFGGVFGGYPEVAVSNLQRDSQNTIDSFKEASEIFSKGLVVDLSNIVLPTGICPTAGSNCLGLASHLRGIPRINAIITGTIGTKLFEVFFGKKDIIVTVIFVDGSTEKYKLTHLQGGETAFVVVPGSATAPSGGPSSGSGSINGYENYASGGNLVIGAGGGGGYCGYYWVQVARIGNDIVSITIQCD